MDGILFPIVITLHILVGVAIIGLVLLQHGKGADMGAAFGSGASGSLFGASGSANFLSRTTAILATVFFLTSLGLSYMATGGTQAAKSVMERANVQPPTAPAAAANPPAAAEDSKAKEIPK
jgi:preprotein translocase subunit SecG